jgi:hypothetical protein
MPMTFLPPLINKLVKKLQQEYSQEMPIFQRRALAKALRECDYAASNF